MKKFSISLLMMVCSWGFAQNTYIDVTTTLALGLFSNNLKTEQEKTVEQQNKLQQAQAWVGTQMLAANAIQNQLLKGLSEVSGTLQNGIQVKQIYDEISRCYLYLTNIKTLVTAHPQYAVFGAKASEKTYEQILKIGTDVSDILASGDLNLATAGDRYRLIFTVSEDVKSLKLWLLTIELNIERAERLGFFNAANPFAGYYNTDKEVVQNIMDKYKYNF